MIGSRQIAKGLGAWVDNEILPMMRGPVKYGAGVAAALLVIAVAILAGLL